MVIPPPLVTRFWRASDDRRLLVLLFSPLLLLLLVAAVPALICRRGGEGSGVGSSLTGVVGGWGTKTGLSESSSVGSSVSKAAFVPCM